MPHQKPREPQGQPQFNTLFDMNVSQTKLIRLIIKLGGAATALAAIVAAVGGMAVWYSGWSALPKRVDAVEASAKMCEETRRQVDQLAAVVGAMATNDARFKEQFWSQRKDDLAVRQQEAILLNRIDQKTEDMAKRMDNMPQSMKRAGD